MKADLIIDGRWRPGSEGARFDVSDPADLSTIVRFDDVDDAVRMANDTEHGLMAYVFGGEREAKRIALFA
jgi:succinate-semialdehyde dehydrogenase / glutarate-semialdehyde dehydrogenase